MSGKDQLFNL